MTRRPPVVPGVMTADELLAGQVKDAVFQVRCSREEKAAYAAKAGGTRQLSAWVRATLNAALGPPEDLFADPAWQRVNAAVASGYRPAPPEPDEEAEPDLVVEYDP